MQILRPYIILLILFLVQTGFISAQVTVFPNREGWRWLLPPVPIPKNMVNVRGIILSAHELRNQDRLLTVTCTRSEERTRLAAVALDTLGQRFEFFLSGSSSSGIIEFYLFRLPANAPSWVSLRYLGLEELTRDSVRFILSPRAYQHLTEKNKNAMSWPETRHPLTYSLKLLDGRRITPDSLKGKIVLFDFWASWCSPCMTKMPALKNIYQRYSRRDFEIIGINYDFSAETALQWIRKEKLDWLHAHAPAGDDLRELWIQACGIEILPHLLLIDRNGILIAEPDIYIMESLIDSLILSR